ncbi:MAG: ABC transporter substrate-binding protein [Candidatus Adiutrix sp.]|jgi:iron complex transport system substrate-binding protein|nr:ABC transporter substrate-binding protein [Candidatus Adiutrix sp.]
MAKKILGLAALLTLFLTLAGPALAAPETRQVLDSNGRPVTIPKEVTRVAPLIPAFAQVTEMLTLGGGKVVAYPVTNIRDYFKKIFPDIVSSNPKNYDSSSVEDIIASGAQVVYGPDLRFSEAQRDQLRQAGLAVVAINGIGSIEEMSQSFQIIGDILGPEESARARAFVKYYQGNAAEATRRTAQIAEKDRARLLVLTSTGGTLSTINKTDVGHQYLTAAGGLNPAADYLPDTRQALTVDPESVVQWDPQFIMTDSQASQEEILNNPALATVDAVKNKRVAICPYGIFLWRVRSAEGAMLPLWLGTLMYPDLFADIDMKTVVRDFFKNYYHYQASPEEIDQVLGGPTQFRPGLM